MAGIWLMLVLTRFSSVSGMSAAIAAPISAFFLGRFELMLPLAGIALLVLWAHRANISRLIRRTEPGSGKAPADMAPTADHVARLRLIRSDNIGPVTYFQLLARFGSAQAAIDAIRASPRAVRRARARLAAKAEIEREIERWRDWVRAIFLGQGLYPPLLAELENAAGADRQGRPQSARPAGGGAGRCAQRLSRRVPLRSPARL